MSGATAQQFEGDALHAARVRLFQNRIREWFKVYGRALPWRRPNQSLYRLVVTEVLLQRTKAESVAAIYDQFFSKYPDWSVLAEADPTEIQVILKYIGLWKRRPPKLIAFANAVVERGGELPKTREELEEIPAVGQYVASAALLFREISNEPLLDAGMARVLERFFGPRKLADIRYDPYLQTLSHAVVDDCDAVSLNWGILDLAALVCQRTRLKCEICPLDNYCHSRQIF